MKFIIGTQFSREFSFEESLITNKLEDNLNQYTKFNSINLNIQNIYIDFICVSEGFALFFKPRPLKILKKEPAIEYEIKLQFDSFFKSGIEERYKILKSEFLSQSKEIFTNKKVNFFDVKEFLSDLENCLLQN